ncbi:hypothetical protein EV183_003807 [Coemansia sp. RSA 2336]|nr:hypothetical protein EV183_003807 [Coemansia sp. RSA 2336]
MSGGSLLTMSEVDNTKRLEFLHSAAHAAFKVCPQLASFYGNEFLTGLGSQRTSNTIMRQLCFYCGSPLVDGLSVSRVKVVSNSAKKPEKRRKGAVNKLRTITMRSNDMLPTSSDKTLPATSLRTKQLSEIKNTVYYSCGMCSTRIALPGSTRSGLQAAGLSTTKVALKDTDTKQDNPKASINPASKPTDIDKPKPSTTRPSDSAAKKRKRHKSNLLATVAANKKKAEEKTNSSSLSLSDFLSGL